MSENHQSGYDEKVPQRLTTTTETRSEETPVTQVRRDRAPNRHKAAVVAIVAVVAIAGLSILAWMLWPSQAGKPVPAPRTLSIEEPAKEGTNPGEQKVTLTSDQVQRAGIKIESVGERAATDMTFQMATGVVQPNAYHETPVISLVGGIVRSISAELGQSVGRGQTLAVVSS